jgi:hypothetical protein
MKGKYPKWVSVLYLETESGQYRSYTGCANNIEMLFDIMDRRNVMDPKHYERLTVDDRDLSEEEIKTFHLWMEKKRKEREENEKRKKAEQAAEDRN